MDALARLLELDQRYRLILHSTDFLHDEILEEAQPDAKQKYFEAEREIDDLRTAHPNLFRKLEGIFRNARGPDVGMTTGDLIDFAYQEHLTLTGEPYLGEFRAAN